MLVSTLVRVTILILQIIFESMVVGAFSGVMILLLSGAVKWKNSDKIATKGFGRMATIGMAMIIASRFSAIPSGTGAVDNIASALWTATSDSVHLMVLLMLLLGLVIPMVIGSSFSTVHILAAMFIPICQRIGLSTASSFITLAVAAALGDAGSIASDSALGRTAGLNVELERLSRTNPFTL
jgi:predicted histidine transporter YuiF (NhaC family)